MTVVMLRKQGNSVGLTFPAETRIRMGLEVGQELTLVELADGVKLVKRNLALERQLRLAEEGLREQADALQEPAKRGGGRNSWSRMSCCSCTTKRFGNMGALRG